MSGAWSRKSTVVKARDSGSHPGGFSLKADPTLSSASKAIVDVKGKRHGVVRKVGAKFTHSRDDYTQKFDSAHAALQQFARLDAGSGGSSGGKND